MKFFFTLALLLIGLDIIGAQNVGRIRALFTANFQKMTLDKINVPTLLDDTPAHRSTFLSDREQTFILASAPPVNF
ncbi:MAG: hypothetical protein ABIQ93_05765 [Saprospiraceae bacterium]